MRAARRSALESLTLNALRIVAGLLFVQHGVQKLFGWLGGMGGPGQTADLLSLMGAAGVIEVAGGLLIAVGLFTRPVALIAAGEMAVAYFMAHVGGAETAMGRIFPILNQGELAVLYCFIFLLLVAHGPGGLSLDGRMKRRKDVGIGG